MRVQLPLPCTTRLGGVCTAGRGGMGAAASGEPGGVDALGGDGSIVGPDRAIRPSVRGGTAGAGATAEARVFAGVGAAGVPTTGGVGRAAVTVADQPVIAGRGLPAAGGPLAGTWVATADGEGFLAALARMAVGRQRPSSLSP